MDNKIQVLKDVELLGQQFKVYGTPEEPMFLAKDVAEWIALSNVSDMVQRVDDDEVAKLNLGGQRGESWFLTENGLYEVLMQSRKPIAKEFKKGVKMILREIRTTGGYIAAREDDTDVDILARAYVIAQETLRRREERIKALESSNKRQEMQIVELSEKVEDMTPKADYCDKILQCRGALATTQVAKDYGMTPNELNKRLKALGVQYKVNKQWVLYAKYQGFGYTVSRTGQNRNGAGSWIDTMWTQKGRLFIYEQLKKVGVLPAMERGKGYELPPIPKNKDKEDFYWQ